MSASHLGMLIDLVNISRAQRFGNLKMKNMIHIAIIIFSLTTIGCSSFGGMIPMGPGFHGANGVNALHPLYPELTQKTSNSFQVFNNNPYALNIGFEEPVSDPMRTPVNGDGGASLNAYAACLTLKVMF